MACGPRFSKTRSIFSEGPGAGASQVETHERVELPCDGRGQEYFAFRAGGVDVIEAMPQERQRKADAQRRCERPYQPPHHARLEQAIHERLVALQREREA